jgi:hypothetical protein
MRRLILAATLFFVVLLVAQPGLAEVDTLWTKVQPHPMFGYVSAEQTLDGGHNPDPLARWSIGAVPR